MTLLTNDEMPALPKPKLRAGPADNRDWFDAEQMRQYARQAVALWKLSSMAQEDERATPPAPAQPTSAEQQPVAWFSPEQKRAMAIIQAAAKALEEGTFTTPPALHEAARMALDAIVRHWDEFGPADGFDEVVDQARRTLIALRAATGEGE